VIAFGALGVGVLFAVGIYLLLGRSTQRIAIGFVFLSNGVNLLVLTTAGLPPDARAPLLGEPGQGRFADPLPQAFVLTAIVIALGATALILALAVRTHHETESEELHRGDAP
jgi:multicomponent Na+:H+ antiporter subunit C